MFPFIVLGVFALLVYVNSRPVTESNSTLSVEEEALLRKDGIDPSGRRDWAEILTK